ncbi:hypothetical protein [Streptomyces mobaraensis]|uniref:hypothetical protein n=1 Tax=Streptomyces mobaraensis TaxID=35621 RepID=UPI001878B752|nr:hypothetical protein [Streptomyces mobaraensis]
MVRRRDERAVTHEVFDGLPPGKVPAHLRGVLVATGTLPPRDERLAALEKWITATVQAHPDPVERRILVGIRPQQDPRHRRRSTNQPADRSARRQRRRVHRSTTASWFDDFEVSAPTLIHFLEQLRQAVTAFARR